MTSSPASRLYWLITAVCVQVRERRGRAKCGRQHVVPASPVSRAKVSQEGSKNSAGRRRSLRARAVPALAAAATSRHSAYLVAPARACRMLPVLNMPPVPPPAAQFIWGTYPAAVRYLQTKAPQKMSSLELSLLINLLALPALFLGTTVPRLLKRCFAGRPSTPAGADGDASLAAEAAAARARAAADCSALPASPATPTANGSGRVKGKLRAPLDSALEEPLLAGGSEAAHTKSLAGQCCAAVAGPSCLSACPHHVRRSPRCPTHIASHHLQKTPAARHTLMRHREGTWRRAAPPRRPRCRSWERPGACPR